MTHRHFGLRPTKLPDPDHAAVRAGIWSGAAFIGLAVVLMIILGVVLYGVSKTVSDVANTTASSPRTTGEGTAR